MTYNQFKAQLDDLDWDLHKGLISADKYEREVDALMDEYAEDKED